MKRASGFDSTSEEMKLNKTQLTFSFLIESFSKLKIVIWREN